MVVLIKIRKALQRRSLIRQTGRQMEFQVQMERKKNPGKRPVLVKVLSKVCSGDVWHGGNLMFVREGGGRHS